MRKYGIGGLMRLTFTSVVPLALTAGIVEGRGIGVGKQSQMTLSNAGRAMNPPQTRSLMIDTEVDSCTASNCGAVQFSGTVQRNNSGDSIPFTADLYADANECLRVQVTYRAPDKRPQPAEMRILLVSPSGSVWKNGGSADSHPAVTALTDVKGHYTLHVNASRGLQPMNSVENFGLSYGRYAPGTAVNCPAPAGAM